MIITLEGNIGSGKSTLAKEFVAYMRRIGIKVIHYEEPVNEWRNLYDTNTNLLQLFYKDKARWAFTFQVNALKHMIDREEEAIRLDKNNDCIILFERSSFSVKYLFNPLLSDVITPVESKILDALCGTMFRNAGRLNNLVMYLHSDPFLCYDRMVWRSREEEKDTIGLEYLKKLHNLHMQNIYTYKFGGPVYTVKSEFLTLDDDSMQEMFEYILFGIQNDTLGKAIVKNIGLAEFHRRLELQGEKLGTNGKLEAIETDGRDRKTSIYYPTTPNENADYDESPNGHKHHEKSVDHPRPHENADYEENLNGHKHHETSDDDDPPPSYGNQPDDDQPPPFGNQPDDDQPPSYVNQPDEDQLPPYVNQPDDDQPPPYVNQH